MTLTDRRSLWIAWIGWSILFLVICAMISSGVYRSAVPPYRLSALNWLAGKDLYDGLGIGGFVYFPQSAIIFIPFAMLPEAAGEILWRLVIIAIFAIGLQSFSHLARGRSNIELFPLMTLVSLPLAWDCARNGQATLAMTGLMLLAVVDIAHIRWWRATLWLVLGVAVKPLIIVLVLLIMAIDRSMRWRALLGIAALALAPFLIQHPGYVLQQYSACLRNMTTAAHVGVVAHGWTTPFTALRTLAGIDIAERVQTVIRILAAAGTLVLCFLARRRFNIDRSMVYVYSLAVLYLMLFSPRTENNTYAMLGPALAAFLALAFQIEKRAVEGVLLAATALTIVSHRPIERLLAPGAEQIWLSPLMAACFAIYLLVRFFVDQQRNAYANVIASAEPQA